MTQLEMKYVLGTFLSRKVTFALLFNSVLLLVIVLAVAQWYRKRPRGSAAHRVDLLALWRCLS